MTGAMVVFHHRVNHARNLVRCALLACASVEIDPFVCEPLSVVLDASIVELDEVLEQMKAEVNSALDAKP